LNRQDEEKVIIGWGEGGYRGLLHANEDPETTKALVLLHVYPDGIEFFDERRKRKWTEKQMLDYRAADLSGRIFLAQIILALAIPWYVLTLHPVPTSSIPQPPYSSRRGIIPIFIPNHPKDYFNQSLYARFRSQSFKEDFWAMQHLQLLRMASQPIDNYLIHTTVPAGVSTYAVLANKPIDILPDEGSNAFYVSSALDMANHVARGKLTLPPVYCPEDQCSQGSSGERTADAIMSLPI
jgi:pimeloyl-ACP methyl ester carboxylesterase